MVNQTIGDRYRLEHLLGSGGMGTVYQGVDTQTQQPVAIKQLRHDLTDDQLIQRFKREGEALRELNHPNIVKMLDAIEENGDHYLVMEYVSGGDLSALLTQGHLPLNQILNIAIDLVDALTRTHRLNIIHRDLKPANILITDDGSLKLTDFGVARVEREERMTDADVIIGTIDYLPPEALNGEEIGHHADIWAFGIILFEMLTGIHPFRQDTMTGTITSILTAPLPDIATHAPDTPPKLRHLIQQMLMRDVSARINSIRHVGAALQDIIDNRNPHRVSTHDDIMTPLRATDSRNYLPNDVTPFLGRADEIAQLHNLLADEHIRLISIVSMGGMGKTRLAIEVGRRHMESFADGVFLVALADISEVDQIPTDIASALGLPLLASQDPMIQIENYCATRDILLILDNFEHLMDAAPLVTQLLQASETIKIIVTTRQRLRLRGETVFNLGGLSMHEDDSESSDVVQLFIQSAQRVNPDFTANDAQLAQIIAICNRVQAMPLAIELAASWVDALSLAEILEDITRSFDLLETDLRDVPDRHRSVRQIITYSVDLLSPQERDVFTQLSVFRGGFTRESAETICNATVRIITGLVSKSLLKRDDDGRYYLHELLRQYGYQVLAQDTLNFTRVKTQHASYFVELIERHDEAILSDGSVRAWEIIEPEMSNIHVAWDWMCQHGMYDDLCNSSQILLNLLEHRNRYAERSSLHKQAIATLIKHPASQERDMALSVMYGEQSFTMLRFGQLEDAMRYGTMAWEILQHIPLDRRGHIIADGRYAIIAIKAFTGHIDEARAMARARLDEYLSWDDSSIWGDLMRGFSYFIAGSVELTASDYEQAIAYATKGYHLLQGWKHKHVLSYLLNDWGNAERALGNLDRAKQLFLESYEAMEQIESSIGMATALTQIASISVEQGNYEDARGIFEQNAKLYREIGDNGELVIALQGLAQIAIQENDYKRTADLLNEALMVGSGLGNLTLSLLVTVGELCAQTHLNDPAQLMFAYVLTDPACTDELANRIDKIEPVPEKTESQPTFDTVMQTARHYLSSHNWQQTEVSKPLTDLTDREMDILRLLAHGMTNKEIAETLVLTVGTVKWYLNQIYSKLYVSNRTEAVVEAQKRNLIPN